jgi:beta-lactam-binding protein with PASTA domain
MLRFLISRVFWLNVLLALLFVLLAAYITHRALSSHTRHGQSLEVPDLTGLSLNEAEQILNRHNLRFVVADSQFFEQKPRMSVLEQDPEAKAKVKEGRIIYLTINTSSPPKVRMPDLSNKSYRAAVSLIESAGLRVGDTVYRPDFAKDHVLDWRYNGSRIEVEEVLEKGSLIDLVLGDGNEGIGGGGVVVPELTGLTYREARKEMEGKALFLAEPKYDNIRDSSTAEVYRQEPEAGRKVVHGETVKIFLRK